MFDTDFYPSITQDLLKKTLNFANEYIYLYIYIYIYIYTEIKYRCYTPDREMITD